MKYLPKLVKIINDNYIYARVENVVKNKSTLLVDSLLELIEITGDEDKGKDIIEATKPSMGTDSNQIDTCLLK